MADGEKVLAFDVRQRGLSATLREIADGLDEGRCSGVVIGILYDDGEDQQVSFYSRERDQLALIGLLELVKVHALRVATLHDIDQMLESIEDL